MSNFLVIGNRQQGKSTISWVLANALNDCVVIFDPNSNFPEIPRVAIVDIDARIQEWSESDTEDPLYIRVGSLDGPEIQTAFDAMAAVLFRWRGYSLIVDEANLLQSPGKINVALDRFLRRSPSDVAIIQNTHRIPDTHVNSRFHSSDWLVFRNEREKDLDALEAEWSKSPEMIREIRELKAYNCVHAWRAHGGAFCWRVWDDPAAWYVPIGNSNKPESPIPPQAGKRRRAARVKDEE